MSALAGKHLWVLRESQRFGLFFATLAVRGQPESTVSGVPTHLLVPLPMACTNASSFDRVVLLQSLEDLDSA
ncbi:MAG: hypothetical protein M3076_20060 [Actinomycetota bacterium]|nr:hypothetical protein [Actinomycetota bacterium]